MSTEDDYARLRRKTGEVGSDTYTSTQLDMFIQEASGNLDLAASRIWGEKKSAYADLVNMSEAGSSRSNSDLFAHAKEQQDYYSTQATGEEAAVLNSSTTRRIERV